MSTADVKLSTSLSTVACVSEEVLACVEEVFACVTESWHPVKSGIDSTPATMNASTLFFHDEHLHFYHYVLHDLRLLHSRLFHIARMSSHHHLSPHN